MECWSCIFKMKLSEIESYINCNFDDAIWNICNLVMAPNLIDICGKRVSFEMCWIITSNHRELRFFYPENKSFSKTQVLTLFPVSPYMNSFKKWWIKKSVSDVLRPFSTLTNLHSEKHSLCPAELWKAQVQGNAQQWLG